MDPSLGKAKASFKTKKKNFLLITNFLPIERSLNLNKSLGKIPYLLGNFPSGSIFKKSLNWLGIFPCLNTQLS